MTSQKSRKQIYERAFKCPTRLPATTMNMYCVEYLFLKIEIPMNLKEFSNLSAQRKTNIAIVIAVAVAGNNSQSQAQTLNKQKLIMFRCESPKRYSSTEGEKKYHPR